MSLRFVQTSLNYPPACSRQKRREKSSFLLGPPTSQRRSADLSFPPPSRCRREKNPSPFAEIATSRRSLPAFSSPHPPPSR
ncbi:hypothetical protein TNCV_2871541 [Trichonephila clavipes]|nr:hypothetical protein TNCV_2871541 [Trichonephila clavipes]